MISTTVGLARKIARPRTPGVLAAASVVLVQLLFVVSPAVGSLPLINGWFLAWAKESSTRSIYKDFFYPFPPLGLWIEGTIPRQFSNPLVAERILQVVTWLILSLLLYLIIRKVVAPLPACIGATVTLAIYCAQPTNIVAGYFELELTFLLGATLLILKGIESNKPVYNFIGGIALSCAVLTKQSALVPWLFIFSFAGFLALRRIPNRSWAQLIWLTVGAALPYLVVTFVLLNSGSLAASLDAILASGGKQPGSGNWISWLFGSFWPAAAIWPFIGIGLTILLSNIVAVPNYEKRKRAAFTSLLIIMPSICLMSFIGLGVFSGTSYTTVQGCVLLVELTVISWILIRPLKLAPEIDPSISEHQSGSSSVAVLLAALAAALFVCLSWVLTSDPSSQLSSDVAAVGVNITSCLLFAGPVGLILLILASSGGLDGDPFIQTDRPVRFSTSQKPAQFILILSLGIVLMNSLSGVLSIESWLIPIAIFIAYVVKFVGSLLRPRAAITWWIVVILIWILFSAGQQQMLPYSWWGLNEPPLSSSRGPSGVASLNRFQLSETTALEYNEISNGIQLANQVSQMRTGGISPYLIGPNLAGLAAGAFELPVYELNCPILWWDVCPERLGQADLTKIQKDPPQSVIWAHAPGWVIDSHERAFRNGNVSSLRNMQDWLTSEVAAGRYSVVKSFPITSSPAAEGWSIQVLSRN